MQKSLFYLIILINIIYTFQYIEKSHFIKLKMPSSIDNFKKCNICKLRVNINEYIPENCTLPIGCPFNRKNIN